MTSIFLRSSHTPASVAQDASIITAGPTVITFSLLEAYCALISGDTDTSSKTFDVRLMQLLRCKLSKWFQRCITAKDKEASVEGDSGNGLQGFTLYFSQLQPTLVHVSLFCYWLRALWGALLGAQSNLQSDSHSGASASSFNLQPADTHHCRLPCLKCRTAPSRCSCLFPWFLLILIYSFKMQKKSL